MIFGLYFELKQNAFVSGWVKRQTKWQTQESVYNDSVIYGEGEWK